MLQIRQTASFRKWLMHLEDRTAKARLVRRFERLADGHAGDYRFLGAALFEMRADFGPGYRVYYMRRGDEMVILLVGGDKASQARDILRARQMIEQLESRK
jgi:putative addiction module killer protein